MLIFYYENIIIIKEDLEEKNGLNKIIDLLKTKINEKNE